MKDVFAEPSLVKNTGRKEETSISNWLIFHFNIFSFGDIYKSWETVLKCAVF